MQTRAVHFEITENQDTSAVINALSRFCDIRGRPDVIISDNQTSFKSTNNELQALYEGLDQEALATAFMGDFEVPEIKWIYNPPRAPHFGGIFEIMVKAMKRAMRAVGGGQPMSEDTFRTYIS